MKKTIALLLVWVMVAPFIFGCADMSKEGKVRCPKCGQIFTHMDEDPDEPSSK